VLSIRYPLIGLLLAGTVEKYKNYRVALVNRKMPGSQGFPASGP
jgi:hypothetical protein